MLGRITASLLLVCMLSSAASAADFMSTLGNQATPKQELSAYQQVIQQLEVSSPSLALPRWENYDGLSDQDHLRFEHGVSAYLTSKLTTAEARDIHSRVHNAEVRGVPIGAVSYVSDDCPDGACPTTSFSMTVTGDCPSGNCPMGVSSGGSSYSDHSAKGRVRDRVSKLRERLFSRFQSRPRIFGCR